MSQIENQRFSIESAFRENFYSIPDYQREYVWTDREVRQLLEDINEQIDVPDREYFIGMILVSPTAGGRYVDVIDGQQRLTTLYLLLCALRQQFSGEEQVATLSQLLMSSYTDSDGNTVRRPKLDPQYENAGSLVRRIVETDASPSDIKSSLRTSGVQMTGSIERLVNAYDTIYAFLEANYNGVAQLKKFWAFVANKVVFIQISTDVSSALKIFETINERGVGLNPMDLLKNLLFTNVKHEEFARLKVEWKKVTTPLEAAREKPLRFLRYFLMANYENSSARGDAVVREDEIYDWFVDKANASVVGYTNTPFAFVSKLIRNVDLYLAFSKGQGNDRESNIAMDSLKRLTGGGFSLHYVLLLAGANLPKALFDYLVEQLEMFLFFYIFTKTPTKDLERNFSLWADELRGIAEDRDQKNQRDRLELFVSVRFESNMLSKRAELDDALHRYTLSTMQQYRTRYLLARITQHVDMAFTGVLKRGSLERFAELEIEHILPNNPDGELLADWADKNPDAEYNDYKIKLGNLALLEKPLNIVAGRDFYAQKRVHYSKSANYLTRSLDQLADVGKNTTVTAINQKLRSFEDWTSVGIDQRQHLLAGLVHAVWKISPIKD
ncbi:DUF262 domain-containing protein [Cryobacterium sp. TMB3-1-2]|nr:DUF262 domain-containing protein [Cryobacterium sp. TMB3-1-2]TFC72013.1 DUF262 domain-containing protein [Cryobacterium sp. TMB3-15]TFC78626.1 DUF262 domain-containing protein [Cryobacterium sp. TMB3-10]TFD44633.1 DUF262 domain-containing protein [Cryobacterium sp. TMB3-12]